VACLEKAAASAGRPFFTGILPAWKLRRKHPKGAVSAISFSQVPQSTPAASGSGSGSTAVDPWEPAPEVAGSAAGGSGALTVAVPRQGGRGALKDLLTQKEKRKLQHMGIACMQKL